MQLHSDLSSGLVKEMPVTLRSRSELQSPQMTSERLESQKRLTCDRGESEGQHLLLVYLQYLTGGRKSDVGEGKRSNCTAKNRECHSYLRYWKFEFDNDFIRVTVRGRLFIICTSFSVVGNGRWNNTRYS